MPCRCDNGHCYDRAKSGYINLLMSQNRKEKRHGDDRAMVEVRTRFLEAGGAFIRAYPLERHLLSLKKLVYDKVYENKPPDRELPGLILRESRAVRYTLHLDSGGDIQSLFMMTPYFYKTSRPGQERLLAAKRLDTEIEFGIDVYRA